MEVTAPQVVVVGGGTMGRGIAHTFREHGSDVHVVERTAESAEQTRTGLEEMARAAAARSPEAPPDRGRLSVGTDLDAPWTPDLVVESVPESQPLKEEVLRRAGGAFPEAILASNTSGLSIDALAAACPDPSRFLGMHFFNPVPRSALVEIVVGRDTEAATVQQTRGWAERLGKECIEVRDSPGFATSRLGIAIGLEAIRMVEEEVASPSDIDRGMVLGYRFPMGPLELSDLVGLDVRLAIADHLAASLGPRFEAPQLLRDLVGRGDLGRKSGAGFYDWSTGSRRAR